MEDFKVGDKVECIYGIGVITHIDNFFGIHSLEMSAFSGVGYPSKTLAVHESNMKKYPYPTAETPQNTGGNAGEGVGEQ